MSTSKILLCLSMIIIFLASSSLEAQVKGLGVGVILGEPTGVSLKKWVNNKHAIDGALAWSFGDNDAFHIHADYLFHNRRSLQVDRSTIPFYYGIGFRLKFEDESKFGVRFPLGVTLFIVEAPIDLFFEIVPILNLAPSTDLDFNAAIGARYYFR